MNKILETNYHGLICNFEQSDSQSHETFVDQSWLITKQLPQNNTQRQEAEKMAKIYLNYQRLGCRYSKQLEHKISKLLYLDGEY